MVKTVSKLLHKTEAGKRFLAGAVALLLVITTLLGDINIAYAKAANDIIPVGGNILDEENASAEKDAVIISFLSSENTMAKKSTGRALIISSVIGVMLVVKYRSDMSDKRSIRPFTSLMKRQQNIPVSMQRITLREPFSMGISISIIGAAIHINRI